MTLPNKSPLGAATAAVASARLQVAEADEHLAKSLQHLERAAAVLDGLAFARRKDAGDVHQEDAST